MNPRFLVRHAVLLAALFGLQTTIAFGITVEGNGQVIEDGDTSPSLADHTDFGNVRVGEEAGVRVFTIRNTGTTRLTIFSVQVGGPGAGAFTVPIAPARTVDVGSATDFAVWFNPGAAGPLTATVRINNSASEDDLAYEFRIRGTGTLPAPEINVTGNGMTIVAGDPLPSPDDHTDFGEADVDQGDKVEHTFTVENLGDANLGISTVQFVAGELADFKFTQAPSNTVFPGRATTFKVQFKPTEVGRRRATVRITNDDPNESFYDFVIQGFGTSLAPEIDLSGNGTSIPNGSTEPGNDDHTNFGSIPLSDGTLTRTFTIRNLGTNPLDLGLCEIVGKHREDFSFAVVPTGSIPGGGFLDFDVVFRPSREGLRKGKVRVRSNDSDENPFEFAIQGFGGGFELLAVERDGSDAVIRFSANPDTTYSTYIYTLQYNDGSFSGWLGVGFQDISGGGNHSFRHINGWSTAAGLWRIVETPIP